MFVYRYNVYRSYTKRKDEIFPTAAALTFVALLLLLLLPSYLAVTTRHIHELYSFSFGTNFLPGHQATQLLLPPSYLAI